MGYDTNSITICGRLTRDVETRQAGNEQMAQFGIAVGYGQDKEKTNFFNVECWGKTAEICAKFIGKGSQVVVNGSLKQDRWTDKDGRNKDSVKIKALSVQFIGQKKEPTPQSNDTQRDDGFHVMDDGTYQMQGQEKSDIPF